MSQKITRPQRVVLYIKDVMLIMGRKKTAARYMYRAMMKRFDKKPGQFITFQEFSIYTGIDEGVIHEYLC